jgi:GT2 family glycosyltransferase
VIVNWNTGDALRECVRSVAAAIDPSFTLSRVVVVDNASSDGSADGLDAENVRVEVVRNRVNRGFAAACNQGGRDSRADYLLFLNPDTRLFTDTLATTLVFFESPAQADVGICGVRLLDADDRPSSVGARFPSVRLIFGEATGLSRALPALFPPHRLTGADLPGTRDVDQIIGAFFLVRGALFAALEGFDERFFVYFEEVDFSLRARLAGYRSVYFADARAHHRGGLSTEQVKAARLFYLLRSRLLFVFKHLSRSSAWLVVLTTFLVEWPARLLFGLATRRHQDVAETNVAYRRLVTFVRTPGWRRRRDQHVAPMA